MTGRVIGNLILMTLICIIIFIVFMAIGPSAHAQGAFWNWPYAPWRIQPGFVAPPLPDPYAPARAMAYAPLPPVAPLPAEPPPASPLGWIYRYYAPCADPACGTLVVQVGADGLNVRVAPDGPPILALVNGTPVIPLQRAGNWVLVAPACPLAPTGLWSWTAGVSLGACL